MDEKPKWFKDHELSNDKEFEKRPTKDEMRAIVDAALNEYFSSKGKLTKNVLIGIAGVVGSLAVIGGGFKFLLGLFGLAVTKQ